MLLPFFDKFRKKIKIFVCFFLNEKLSTGFYLYSNQYLHLKINSCLFGLLFLYFSTFSSFQVQETRIHTHKMVKFTYTNRETRRLLTKYIYRRLLGGGKPHETH